MYIYKTINLLNNKIYIGKCEYSINKSTYYLGSGAKLRVEIKKHGKNNFKKEILKECFDKKELKEAEIHFIHLYDSTNPDIGYNVKYNKIKLTQNISIYIKRGFRLNMDKIIREAEIRNYQDAYREIITLGLEQFSKKYLKGGKK